MNFLNAIQMSAVNGSFQLKIFSFHYKTAFMELTYCFQRNKHTSFMLIANATSLIKLQLVTFSYSGFRELQTMHTLVYLMYYTTIFSVSPSPRPTNLVWAG